MLRKLSQNKSQNFFSQHKHVLQFVLALLLLSTSLLSQKESSRALQNWDAQWKNIFLPYSTLERSAHHCTRSDQYWLACKQAAVALTKFAGKNARHLDIHADTNFPNLFARIREDFYHGDVPSAAVAAGWNALLHAFDPHANLSTLIREEELATQKEESFSGIGIKTQNAGARFRVSSVVAGAPAERAGVKAGDEIIAINAIPTEELASEHLFQQLNGAPGSKLVLTLENQGHRKKLNLYRSNIKIPAIQTKILNGANAIPMGYLTIHHFNQENICSDIRLAIELLQKQNVRGFILDLRGNPGGYVKEAQCTASLFLGHGKLFASFQKINNSLNIVPHQKRSQKERSDFSLYTLGAQVTSLPLLVLIDRNTASAAEILAAALQDHARALVRGEKTFGKGLMQSMYTPWNNSAIVLAKSTHEIFRPNGAPLQLYGVIPTLGGALQNRTQSNEANLLREEDLQRAISRQ